MKANEKEERVDKYLRTYLSISRMQQKQKFGKRVIDEQQLWKCLMLVYVFAW